MTADFDRGAANPFGHSALYYSGPEVYLDGIVPFVEAAFAADEPVAVAVPEPRLELLRDGLGDAAADLLMVDMTEEGANPGRILPGVLHAFADKHPGRRVRMVAESIWPDRTDAEYPACAQYEALVNLAFAGKDAVILCPFDVDGLDERAIDDAQATHPVLIGRGGGRASGAYDPERVIAAYNLPLEDRPRTAIEREVDRDTIDNARWFAIAFGRKAGLTGAQLIDLEIAVNELATHSVLYGGGTGMLRIWTDEERLVCEVADAGHLTDPLAGYRPFEREQDYGRGLLLINQVVDLLRIHTGPGGTTMRIHLRLPAGGPGSKR
jgi:anti-sigma regulatory factor (Ser/Thr protein kinase)